jgi:hypothetical protein
VCQWPIPALKWAIPALKSYSHPQMLIWNRIEIEMFYILEWRQSVNILEWRQSVNFLEWRQCVNFLERRQCVNFLEWRQCVNFLERRQCVNSLEQKQIVNILEQRLSTFLFLACTFSCIITAFNLKIMMSPLNSLPRYTVNLVPRYTVKLLHKPPLQSKKTLVWEGENCLANSRWDYSKR